MLSNLDALHSDFSQVDTLAQLSAFASKYALSTEGIEQSASPNVLRISGAVLEGVEIRVTHRWHDPSGPFQNLPDVNKLVLEVGGKNVCEIAFEG